VLVQVDLLMTVCTLPVKRFRDSREQRETV
jgi:hypothetical protein